MISDLLAKVRTAEYHHQGDLSQPIFGVLEQITDELRDLVPSHYMVTISKGVGGRPRGLWVSILDPEVTKTPTKGIYVVFLFDEERTQVSLSLNQGVTAVGERAREIGADTKTLLREEAALVRSLLGADVSDLVIDLELGRGDLVRKYAAGNVYARTWQLDALPGDDDIAGEVERFLSLYADAVVAKEIAVLRGASQVPPRDPELVPKERPRAFKPKNDADYKARIEFAVQKRSRVHETLVKSLGYWAKSRGFEPNTEVHPRDLMLHRADGLDYLVEVKVFPAGRPLRGTRECIGQLFEYRYFYGTPDMPLVAALSEDPGAAYVDLNTALRIATMWPNKHGVWHGCALARDLNLVD
jgi:hypothetical protein